MKELWEIEEEMINWQGEYKKFKLVIAHEYTGKGSGLSCDQKLDIEILRCLGFQEDYWCYFPREGVEVSGHTFSMVYNSYLFASPEQVFMDLYNIHERQVREVLERYFVDQLKPWDVWHDLLIDNENARRLTSHSKKNRKELA